MADKNIKGLTYVVDIDGTKFEGGMKQLNGTLNATKKEMRELDKALKLDPSDVEALERKFTLTQKSITLTNSKLDATENKLQELRKAKEINPIKIKEAEDDIKKLVSEIKKMKQTEGINPLDIEKAETDLSKMKSDLKTLRDKHANIDVTIGYKQAEITKLKTELKSLDKQKIEVSTQLSGNALGDIDKVKSAVKDASSRDIEIDADASKASSKIDALKDKLGGVGDSFQMPNFDNQSIGYLIAGITTLTTAYTTLGTASIVSAGGVNAANASMGLSAKIAKLMSTALSGLAIAGVGTLVVALGGLAVGINQAFNEHDAVKRLRIELGLSKEEAVKYKDAAIDLWKNGFGDTQEEALKNLISVKQNFKELSDVEISKLTENLMTARDVVGEDFSAVLKTSTVLMRNFKISGEEASDIIIKMTQYGGNYSEELLDTLREYSTQFKAMGFTAGEFANILIKGSKEGAWNLDKVGDAIKEFTIRSKDGSESTNQAFKDLKLNHDQMGKAFADGGDKAKQAFYVTTSALAQVKNEQERNRLGVALFGTQYEDLEKTTVLALTSVKGELEGVKGETQKVKDIANEDPFIKFNNALRNLQSNLGNLAGSMMPGIAKMFDGLSSLDFNKIFQGLYESVSGLGNKLGVLIAENPQGFAIGVGLLIVGGITIATVGLPALLLGLGALLLIPFFDGMMKPFNGSWNGDILSELTNGFNAVVVGIGKYFTSIDLLGIGICFGKLTSEFLNGLSIFFANITQSINQVNWGEIGVMIANAIGGMLQFLVGWIWETVTKTNWGDLVFNVIVAIGSAIGALCGVLVGFVFQSIGPFFSWVGSAMQSGWNAFVGWLRGMFFNIGKTFYNFFRNLPNDVANFGSWIWNSISGGLSAMGGWLLEKISSFGQTVSNGFQSIAGRVAGVGGWIWNAVSAGLSNLGSSIWNSVSGIGNNVVSAFQAIPGKIGDFGGQIWNSVSSGLNALWDKMWNKFNDLKNMAGDAMNKINPMNWFRSGAVLDFGFHTSVLASVGRLHDGYAAEMRSLNAGSSIVNNSSVRNITQRPIFNVTVNASNDNDVKNFMNEIQNVLGGLINA